MLYKNLACEVKNVEPSQRLVEGYLSCTQNRDSVGDWIMPGAYTKTLAERKDDIQFCWQHDMNIAIGKFTELKEDDYGLFFSAKLTTTPKAEEALTLYKDGILKAHSIGYQLVQGKWDYVKDPITKQYNYDQRNIQEVKLWEGSAVLFPANDMAIVTSIKSIFKDKNNTIASLEELVSETLFMYRRGDISKEDIMSLKSMCEIELIGKLDKALELTTEPQEEPDTQEEVIEPLEEKSQIIEANTDTLDMLNTIQKLFKEI